MTSTYDHCIEIQSKYNYLIGTNQYNDSEYAAIEELPVLVEGGINALINALSKDRENKNPRVWVVCVQYTINDKYHLDELEGFCKKFNIPFDL